LNGTLVVTKTIKNYTQSAILSRTKCFIGKSNWASDGYTSSHLDDLRFYNKSLNQDEVVELMNQYKPSKKIFFYLKIRFFLF
jgi:hypothetical protein